MLRASPDHIIMAKDQTTKTEPAPQAALVKVRALQVMRYANCQIAPGAEFPVPPEKAEEMVAAGTAVILPPSF
jgi:hypothetical protein